MVPEFVGRLPVIAVLDELDEDSLVRILLEPKNSLIKQYKKLFELDGIELNFEPLALRAIANQAITQKTGARGLRSIVEKILQQSMFELPSDNDVCSITVTEACVLSNEKPQIKIGKKKSSNK